MFQIIEPVIGVALGLIVLLDIFFIVLHARADTGPVSRIISMPVWKAFIGLAPL